MQEVRNCPPRNPWEPGNRKGIDTLLVSLHQVSSFQGERGLGHTTLGDLAVLRGNSSAQWGGEVYAPFPKGGNEMETEVTGRVQASCVGQIACLKEEGLILQPRLALTQQFSYLSLLEL